MATSSPETRSTVLAVRDQCEDLSAFRRATQWLGERIHPNRITVLRSLGAPLAMAAAPISQAIAATVFAIGSIGDWVDGAVARRCNLRTREGALLDTAVDKLTHAASLGYLAVAYPDLALALASTLSVVLNIRSQLQRGPLSEQWSDMKRGFLKPSDCEVVEKDSPDVHRIQANAMGKIKHVIECCSIVAMFAAGQVEEVQAAAAGGLIISSGCSVLSTMKRQRAAKTEVSA